ncbi:hypothetical protein ACE3MZ_02190 [Paenibacillus sp. WLX1005]|uniref:hypothetical protein n=1 Tax=Paenibacillus sp. WLX1005 TaxID=3243766 RepID=UPI003984329A
MSNEVAKMIKSLPEVELSYWKNVLRVDTDRIRNALKNPESGVLDRMLQKITKSNDGILELLNEIFLFEDEVKTSEQIRTELALKYADDKHLIVLLLCQEFLKNKHQFSKNRIYSKFLKGKTDVLGSFEKKDLFRCILLLSLDWKKMIYYILFDSHEKAAIKRYKLVPDENEGRFEKAEQILKRGINIETYLKEEDIDSVLAAFEKNEGNEGVSRSLEVLSESDYITLFVQRNYKPTNILEQNTTIFGDETKVVIMMFNRNGMILNQHSVQKDSTKLAGFLMSNAYKLRLRYVESNDANANEIGKFKNVLGLLLADQDEFIDIVSVEYRNFEVVGHPIVKIIKTHTTPLSETIEDFKNRGFGVLNNPDNIIAIKLKFKSNENDKANTITLSLRVTEDGVVLYYFNNRLGKAKTEYFHIYMQQEYGIIVIPDAANQKDAK